MPVPNAAEQLSLLQQSMLQMQQASMGSDESGLISGPIKRKRREKREAVASQQLAEQTRAVEAQRGGQLLDMYDPVNFEGEDLSRFVDVFNDPVTRPDAIAHLNMIRQTPQQRLKAEQEAARALTEAQRAEFDLGRAQQLAPIEMLQKKQALANAQQTGLNAQQTGRNLQQTNQINERTLAVMPESVTAYNPITGLPANVPITGATYVKNQTAADTLQRTLTKTNEMIGLIEEYGTELGGDVGRRMSQLRFGIIVGANQAAGAGAPTGNELEEIAKGLPDPAGFFNNLASVGLSVIPGMIPEQREALMAGYQQYAKDLSLSLKQQLAINPAITNVDFTLINPSVWKSPDERAFYEANTGRNWLESP